MKKNKIIGFAVASFGAVASISLAAALYTRAATDATMGISQGTYEAQDGTITYKINGNTSGSIAPHYLDTSGNNGGTGLGKVGTTVYNQIEYLFPLSATFASPLIAQDFIVGNLSVTVNNIPAEWQSKLAIWVEIDGYGDNTEGKHQYEHKFMDSDYAITSSAASYSANNDVAVASNGGQTLRVLLKFDATTVEGLDLYTRDEASLGYTLSVHWGEASSAFKYAYVVGNKTLWAKDTPYRMAPNINKAHSEGFEWVYNRLPGDFVEAKCVLETAGDDVWSDGNNAPLDSANDYNVYWNGSGSSSASFNAIVVNP